MNLARIASPAGAFGRSVIAVVFAFGALPSAGHAQANVELDLTGGPVSFGSATAADFDAATLEAPDPMPFQVTTTAEPSGSFTTTVKIRSSTATLGGGKPLSDMEWRRGDESTWHALTSSDVLIESRTNEGTPEGHTWSNVIYFRVALRWTSDPPANYAGNLVLTVSTTQP
jgi:hypothetical protein